MTIAALLQFKHLLNMPEKILQGFKEKKSSFFLFSGLIANEQAEQRRLNATRSIAADRKILDDVRCRFPGDFSGVRFHVQFHVTFAISFLESALLCPAEGSRPLGTRLVTFDDLCCKTNEPSKFGQCSLPHYSGAPNENIVQNHLNIELLNVF